MRVQCQQHHSRPCNEVRCIGKGDCARADLNILADTVAPGCFLPPPGYFQSPACSIQAHVFFLWWHFALFFLEIVGDVDRLHVEIKNHKYMLVGFYLIKGIDLLCVFWYILRWRLGWASVHQSDTAFVITRIFVLLINLIKLNILTSNYFNLW